MPTRIMFLGQEPRQPAGDEYPTTAEKQQRLNQYASPGTTIDMHWPEDSPGAKIKIILGEKKALNGLHHIMEAGPIIQKVVWAYENGYDAVVMSNTFDPGVEGARMAVPIPVIGICRVCLNIAATMASNIGVIVPLAGHVKEVGRLVNEYGLRDKVVSLKPLGRYGKEFADEKAAITHQMAGISRKMIDEAGAEIILPLGGALIPWIVDPKDIAAAVGAPIIHTHKVAIAFAEMCVRIGLSHSPLAYETFAGLRPADFSAHAYK